MFYGLHQSSKRCAQKEKLIRSQKRQKAIERDMKRLKIAQQKKQLELCKVAREKEREQLVKQSRVCPSVAMISSMLPLGESPVDSCPLGPGLFSNSDSLTSLNPLPEEDDVEINRHSRDSKAGVAKTENSITDVKGSQSKTTRSKTASVRKKKKKKNPIDTPITTGAPSSTATNISAARSVGESREGSQRTTTSTISSKVDPETMPSFTVATMVVALAPEDHEK